MIVIIKKDDIIDDYKKISKISRINYIFNATDSPKIRDFGNVLSEFDSTGETNISATSFQISDACYDMGIPERTRTKKLDAFFASQEFAANIIQIVSEQLLHPNANYLIALQNNDYEKFHDRYLEAFAEIFEMDDVDDFIFLYDDTRRMYKFADTQLNKKLNKIDDKLNDDDENDDLLDARDDIYDKINSLKEADDPDISDKKARKIVRKIFLDSCFITKKVIKKLTKSISRYQETSKSRRERIRDDDDDE